MEDKRFSHILSDPKFRKIPKTERKVKIDDRFKVMFTGKQFKTNYTIDKRGRPVNQTSSEDLKRYYHLSSGSDSEECDSEEDEEKEQEDVKAKKGKKKKNKKQSVLSEGDKTVSNNIKKKLKNLNVDYARGEAQLFSESSSDDSEGEEDGFLEGEGTEGEVDHKWGELDADADRTDEITSRIAACNMDWDRIRAIDLMVLFNSFVPPGGLIKSVEIYPSEFGLQRMKEEDVKGPIELVEGNDDEETEEGAKYHMEKLRQYQLNRLKYYYAVISFDSPNTANKIYTECDGMEYESSATKLDLRFIPEDMSFDHDPKEVCTKLPDMSKYQPRFFTTTALQQAKVDLTWDETDPDRLELAQKLQKNKLEEIDDNDLSKFVAMSSEDESENEQQEKSEDEQEGEDEDKSKKSKDQINKYRALLLNIEKEDEEEEKNDVEMEFEWKPELEEKAENMVKQKLAKDQNDLTPFEKYLEKRKEKRKEKKKLKKQNNQNSGEDDDDFPSDIDMNDPYFAEEFNSDEFKKPTKKSKTKNKKNKTDTSDDVDKESKQKELELLLLDEEEDKIKHFSLNKIQKSEQDKKKKGKKNKGIKKSEEDVATDDFEINVKDDRFQALYTSHQYNIDPTDPQFKKTKNMQRIIEEKLKRKSEVIEEDNGQVVNPSKKSKAELRALIKSVKNKTQSFNNK